MSVAAPPPQDELELLIREARERQRRRRVAGAALALLAGAALVAYSATRVTPRSATRDTPTVRPSGAASCRADQLAISFVHKGAVMGEEGGLLRFTNTGRGTCTVSGWPRVVAVTGSGSRVPADRIAHPPMLFATYWLHGPRVPRLALRHGASGYAILGGFDNPAASGRPATWRCPSARRFLVSPPGSRRQVNLSGFLWSSGGHAVDVPLCGGKPFISPIRRPVPLQ